VELARFYDRLLVVLRQPVVREGRWQLLQCTPAWEGNWTWDCFLVFAWQDANGDRLLAAVNSAPNQSQGYVQMPFAGPDNRRWRLTDLLCENIYDRDGSAPQGQGLYLELAPWKAEVFSVQEWGHRHGGLCLRHCRRAVAERLQRPPIR
jgi:hypothetical protein